MKMVLFFCITKQIKKPPLGQGLGFLIYNCLAKNPTTPQIFTLFKT